MRINIVQFSPTRDIKKNYDTIRSMVDESADMLVLPELSDYGYFVNREFLDSRDLTLFPLMMEELSRELKITVIFGAAEKDGDDYYDTLFAMENGYLVGTYRKIHLTDYEKNTFTEGERTAVFTLNSGLRIAPAICFDLWFPEVFREGYFKNIGLFVTIGAFGGRQSLSLARARCAENAVPMVLANRVGDELYNGKTEPFLGDSRFISYYGEVYKEGKECEEDSFSYDVPLIRKNGNIICSDLQREIRRHYLV